MIFIAVLSACNSPKKTTKELAAQIKDSAIRFSPPIIDADLIKNDSLIEEVNEKTEESTQQGIILEVIPEIISLSKTQNPVYSLTNTSLNNMRVGFTYRIHFLDKNNEWVEIVFSHLRLDRLYSLMKDEPQTFSLNSFFKIKPKPGLYKISDEVEIYDIQTKKHLTEIISTLFEVVE